MRNIMLALVLLCSAPAQALQQPFFDIFDQHLQRVSFGLKKPTFTGELQHYGNLYRGYQLVSRHNWSSLLACV